jgi:flagellar motility protein MotE (MotC chaperone)
LKYVTKLIIKDKHMKLKNLLEQMDLNDPALMRARASKDQFQAAKAAEAEARRKRVYGKQREALEDELWDIAQDLRTAYADRRNLMQDMEQEAEPEGGDVANEYGSVLNTLDAEIEALKKRRDAIETRLAI